MAGIGAAIRGFGRAYKTWKRNKESAKIFKDAKKGKYPAIDKALKNIKKSGNIFGE